MYSFCIDDIQKIRNCIFQKNICDRAISTYEKKLKEREIIAAYQQVSPFSCLVKQSIYQYGVEKLRISIATFSADYLEYLQMHFAQLGKETYDDIPAFFCPDYSKLAISYNHLFFMNKSNYNKYNLSDIRSFSVEKRLLQESLVVNFSNGKAIFIPSGFGIKNTQKVADFLNFVYTNAQNTILLSRYQPYSDHVVGFSAEQFEKRPFQNLCLIMILLKFL